MTKNNSVYLNTNAKKPIEKPSVGKEVQGAAKRVAKLADDISLFQQYLSLSLKEIRQLEDKGAFPIDELQTQILFNMKLATALLKKIKQIIPQESLTKPIKKEALKALKDAYFYKEGK